MRRGCIGEVGKRGGRKGMRRGGIGEVGKRGCERKRRESKR